MIACIVVAGTYSTESHFVNIVKKFWSKSPTETSVSSSVSATDWLRSCPSEPSPITEGLSAQEEEVGAALSSLCLRTICLLNVFRTFVLNEQSNTGHPTYSLWDKCCRRWHKISWSASSVAHCGQRYVCKTLIFLWLWRIWKFARQYVLKTAQHPLTGQLNDRTHPETCFLL